MASFRELLISTPTLVALRVADDFNLEGYDLQVVLDCSSDESHGRSASVSEFPIELGSPAGDHIQPGGARLSLAGTVTDTPTTLLGNVFTSTAVRSIEAYDVIEAFMLLRLPVDVVTSLRSYRNMAIVDFEGKRGPRVGRALKVMLKLQEFFTVSTSQTFAAAPTRATTPMADAKKKGGGAASRTTKAAKTAPAPAAAKFQSMANEAGGFEVIDNFLNNL